MAQIVVVPDSFKGSMTSVEVADIIVSGISERCSKTIRSIPIADGGEGSVECVLDVLGGRKKTVIVKSPENTDIDAYYGITDSGIGIIEFAQSSGITKQTSYVTKRATSYGFGELVKDALDEGVREFILTLGGSATTDGACGMACALGIRFLNSLGEEFIPLGESLADISRIDLTNLDSRVTESRFTVMCDVNNPLYGPSGAAYVYGPQKGATKDDLLLLDKGLSNLCSVFKSMTGKDYSVLPGGGAAGGAGFGCVAFLNATLKSGIELMLDLCNFEEELKDCEMIITGEGKLDEQSLMGKVLTGVKKYAGDIRVVSICGICDLSLEVLNENGIEAYEIGRGLSLEESMLRGKELLYNVVSKLSL